MSAPDPLASVKIAPPSGPPPMPEGAPIARQDGPQVDLAAEKKAVKVAKPLVAAVVAKFRVVETKTIPWRTGFVTLAAGDTVSTATHGDNAIDHCRACGVKLEPLDEAAKALDPETLRLAALTKREKDNAEVRAMLEAKEKDLEAREADVVARETALAAAKGAADAEVKPKK